MIRRLLTGAVATSLAATSLLAAGLVATAAPASAATCTGSTVIYHTYLTYGGDRYGYVDLEYSTACHSARAHIHSIYPSVPGDAHGAWATIKRVGADVHKDCTLGYHEQDCRTGWLYDLNPYKATAHGDVDLYPSGGYHDATGTTPAY